jgi:hypothetical protein
VRRLPSFALLISVAAACAIPARAQQPPDSVASDACSNTAMGGRALFANQNGTDCVTSGYNTAAGYESLYYNTTGQSNTAFGAFALNANVGATMSDAAAGSNNTAVGLQALYLNTSGAENTAIGVDALLGNTTGNANTASGFAALNQNTSGTFNTASGFDALSANTTGNNNTGYGYAALNDNTTGSNNTATGWAALFSSKTGQNNTASGYEALTSNTTGSDNTASGYDALFSNTVGNYNNAMGYFALHNNTGGSQNSASGVQALYGNKTGNYNTASGTDALFANTTGSSNIAEGYKAGYNLTTGSNNIDIGNLGAAAESGTIRIGTTSTQTATYVAGIYGTSVTGSAVVVSSAGQLGVTVSSERYKTNISPMGTYTAKLTQLRPVTFHLKTDPGGALQSGLIAEEVAKVYPELVIRSASGRIDGVRYDELAPMLLNEVQQQAAQIRDLKQQVAELASLKQELHGALLRLDANAHVTANR